MGLFLGPLECRKLLAYLTLLEKWNRVYNLTAIRDPDEMITHHLLDALAVLPFLLEKIKSDSFLRILDVGTGGGVPGIPWAIACPAWQVTLVDVVKKKTAFLSQVKSELALTSVVVHTERVELLSPSVVGEGFDIITSRAFSDLDLFVQLAGRWLAIDGRMVPLKGEYPSRELALLSDAWQVEEVHALAVPSLNAQRHVLLLKPNGLKKGKY